MKKSKKYLGTGTIATIIIEEDEAFNTVTLSGEEETKKRYNLTSYFLSIIVEDGNIANFEIFDKFNLIYSRFFYAELISKLKDINHQQFLKNQPFIKIIKNSSNDAKQNEIVDKIIKDIQN